MLDSRVTLHNFGTTPGQIQAPVKLIANSVGAEKHSSSPVKNFPLSGHCMYAASQVPAQKPELTCFMAVTVTAAFPRLSCKKDYICNCLVG